MEGHLLYAKIKQFICLQSWHLVSLPLENKLEHTAAEKCKPYLLKHSCIHE